MGVINDLIENYKKQKEGLELTKKKRENCDICQFFMDSMNFKNGADGMVIIITKDKVYRKLAPKGITHKRIAQDIVDSFFDKHIDLNRAIGDYGNLFPDEGIVFIRVAALINGPSIIYYPNDCNDFQINELNKINDEVKEFNTNNENQYQAVFEYSGQTSIGARDLDEVLRFVSTNSNDHTL